jgi:predicted mannosyl-3-phosphoglycerate phosphatase (HAD superfamily)
MKLFQAHIYSDIKPEGVFVHFSAADAVDVHGKLYAELGGSLYAAEGWHETEEAAREEAAAKVEAMSQVLQAQAGRIRAGGR